MSHWTNRIVGSGVKPASDFLAHELNWKIHPRFQQDAILGSLDQVGWYKSVVESSRSGKLLDGHARIILALRRGDDTPVPYEVVDVSEAEEAIILATLDPLVAMAVGEEEKLKELLSKVSSDNDALNDLFDDLARTGIGVLSQTESKAAENRNIDAGLMVFLVLYMDEVAILELALRKTGEINRAKALALICQQYLDEKR